MFGKQPVAIVALAVVALQAVQEAAIKGLPLVVHLGLAVAIIALGAVVARAKVVPLHLGPEPVAVIGGAVAFLQVAQQAVTEISPGVRIAITAAVVGLGAVIAHNAVTPVPVQ